MKFKYFILPVLVFLSSQLNAQKIQDQYFQSSYDEISAMLEGKQSLDFERAVFLTENAYRGNVIEYKDFKAVLNLSTEMIQQLIKANDKQDWKQYVRGTKVTPQRELQAKDSYQRALTNWAIYTWMTDTVEVRLNDQQFLHLPLSYSNEDPFGTTDWRNSQTLNLFESGKGNCYALVTLFKILSERFKSEASIVTAPQHIYIEHRDPNGNTFNVELATRSFPNMGSIQTLTYTTREGLLNDISMRSLDLKQSIGLCLIYLAKGYQYKHNISDDEFLLNCATRTLQYDPKNLNALLLKAQVCEQRVMKQQMEAAPYESLLADLYALGYRQMPDDMRDIILSKIQGRQAAPVLADKNPNPYQNIGEQARYVTLSNGLFDEVHQSQKIVRYGRTIFDTEKSKIIRFLDEDISSYQVDPVVFALSVDPITRSFPMLTPYQFAGNTPIQAIDLEGLEPESFMTKLINLFGFNSVVSLEHSTDIEEEAHTQATVAHSQANLAEIKSRLDKVYEGQKMATNILVPGSSLLTETADVKLNKTAVGGAMTGAAFGILMDFVGAGGAKGAIKGSYKYLKSLVTEAVGGNFGAANEIRVAKWLREQGNLVEFIGDKVWETQSKADVLVNGIKTEFKATNNLDNLAGNLAKGVKQVGDGGQIFVTRGDDAAFSIEALRDFIKNFTPQINGKEVNVKISTVDHTELPKLQ